MGTERKELATLVGRLEFVFGLDAWCRTDDDERKKRERLKGGTTSPPGGSKRKRQVKWADGGGVR